MEDGQKLFFDLEKICEFVTYSDSHKTKDVEIIVANGDNYEETGDKFNSKTVRENIISSNQQIDTMRYDLVKTLIMTLMESDIYERGEETGFTLGEQLAINTLMENNMLKM